MNYIWEDKLPQKTRAVFTSLLVNLYIDVSPRYKKQMPNQVHKIMFEYPQKKLPDDLDDIFSSEKKNQENS